MVESRKHSQGDPKKKPSEEEKGIDLDYVLINELGQIGRFQIYNFLLVAFPIMSHAFLSEYVFSAAAIPHRCQIRECGEWSADSEFSPAWLAHAVGAGAACERFVARGNGSLQHCPAELFDPALTQPCDGYVYARNNSVIYDFDLGCQDWLRVLAGTLNSVGQLLVLPIAGYISDRFGRRVALIVSVFNLALVGLIRAFSVNYPMYLAMQILQSTLGAGTFSSAYIFATELVGPKYRTLIGALCNSMFAVGHVIMGTVAYFVYPWRYMIIAIHVPCFLIIVYFWILSESIRWLLSKKKFNEARAALEKVAKVNKTYISESSKAALMIAPEAVKSEGPNLFKTIIRSPILLRRVCTTPIWWISTTFIYYGLSINSTGLSEAMHLNYILTATVEIPGNLTAALVLNRIGRKATLSIGFFLSTACSVAFAFIPNELLTLRMVLFLLGKFGISMVFTSLYLYTSELYPTEYRHSLLGFSSMIGRIGSITAPLTPVLAMYWDGIPSLLFGFMGLLSGLLVLTQPETLGTKMPDTLIEAEELGVTKKSSAEH